MTCPIRWAWDALRITAALSNVTAILARDRIEVLAACCPLGWPR